MSLPHIRLTFSSSHDFILTTHQSCCRGVLEIDGCDEEADRLAAPPDRTRVDMEEVLALKARLGEINGFLLEQIDWHANGKPVNVPPRVLDDFKFTGLSNADFVTTDSLHSTTQSEGDTCSTR